MESRKQQVLQLDAKLKELILSSVESGSDAVTDFFLHEAHEGHESCFDADLVLEECSDNVVPWVLYNWQAEEDKPVLAEQYLQANKAQLSQEEQDFITASLNVPFRFYQINSLNEDDIALTDVLSGEKFTVFAEEIDEAYELEDVITARIVQTPAGAYLASVMDVILPEDAVEDIKAIQTDSDWDESLCDDLVRQVYFDLSAHYLEEDEEHDEEWDEDENELQFVTLNYQLKCSAMEAFELLYPLCSEDAREGLLEGAVKADTGELKQITFPWLDEDADLEDQDIEESMLGMVTIEDASLTIEVNSVMLASIIKAHVEEVCGQHVTLVSESIENLEDVLASLPEEERKLFDEA